MSDDTPTVRFDQSVAPGSEPPPAAGSRRLMTGLAIAGGILLLAVIVLLVLLLTRQPSAPVSPTVSPTPTPTVSATPSATPSPTPTSTPTQTEEPPAPPPPPPAPTGPIKAFAVDDSSVDCSSESSVPIRFAWETTGVTLWFGVGTDNAKFQPYDTFPLVHVLDFEYQCGQPGGEQRYTITVEQSNGDLLSKTLIVTE